MMENWSLENKFVLLRVDFNVPISNGIIQDDTRIVKSLPTIRYLLSKQARLIVMSHLGRPLKALLEDGSIDYASFSLRPIAGALEKLLNVRVMFANDCGGPDTRQKRLLLEAGQMLLLENTRFNPQEEKGDPQWAKQMADLGEYYVNDAFGAAHREHATTATIARHFDSAHKDFGLLMRAEIENGKKVLENPERPFTAIIGGAKVSDKIGLIENLIHICDHVLIGGGMAYTFLASQGYRVGNSKCEMDKLALAKELVDRAKNMQVDLCLPLDSIQADRFAKDAMYHETQAEDISDHYMGLDIGPRTRQKYCEIIQRSKTIVWNGPMGVFEFAAFAKGTESVARAVAEATANGAYSLVGGGDSVAALNAFGLNDQVSYVSTGGGAMLEMLEGKLLPGIDAILTTKPVR